MDLSQPTSRSSIPRERILAAADRVATASGVGELSIEAAAAEAGVSRASAYRCFGGRRDLVVALAHMRLERHIQVAEERMRKAPSFEAKIEELFLYLPVYQEDDVIASLAGLRDLTSDEPIRQAGAAPLTAVIAEARERREVRDDVPVDAIVTWLLDQQWLILGWRTLAPERIRRRVRDFVLPSIVPTACAPQNSSAIGTALGQLEDARGSVDAAIRALRRGARSRRAQRPESGRTSMDHHTRG